MGTVAVIVLSHRAPAQVARLVDRITEGEDTIAVVHHDPRGEALSLRASPQIAMIPDATPCQWGRLSLVEAQWRSLGWVAKNIPDFSWALLVSGQDYPIRRMGNIEKELANSPHGAYLRHFPIDGDPADDVDPWQPETRHRYLRKRRIPFSRRSVPLPWRRRAPFRLWAGDMWFNLSAPAVHTMLGDRRTAEDLFGFLRYAPVPDEAFIACMALNSGVGVANNSRRFIEWIGDNPHPELITAAHMNALAASDAFFARKVDAERHPDVPDLLDDLATARA